MKLLNYKMKEGEKGSVDNTSDLVSQRLFDKPSEELPLS